MSTEIATKSTEAEALELALLGDDLSRLSPPQRLFFYNRTCESLGLNPLTKPFSYITLNGKLTLYAKRDCTDQLRKIHGVSVTDLADYTDGEGTYVVTAKGRDRDGRVDAAKGAVFLGQMKGETRANAIMKAETKAKRRLTLSLCGLGMLDETEVDLPGAVLKDTDVVHDIGNAKEANGKPTPPPPQQATEAGLVKESETLFPDPEHERLVTECGQIIKTALVAKTIKPADVRAMKLTYLGAEDADPKKADVAALSDLRGYLAARFEKASA